MFSGSAPPPGFCKFGHDRDAGKNVASIIHIFIMQCFVMFSGLKAI